MPSKVTKGIAAIALGLALGVAVLAAAGWVTGLHWWNFGNTEVDGWYVSAGGSPDPHVLVKGTEEFPLDLNVSRADVGGGDGYTGPLGFDGKYSNRIPADRPFEIRFVGYGNVSNLTASITIPAYYDGPGDAPPKPGGAAHAECKVEEQRNTTKTYPEGRLVINDTAGTCRFRVNLSEPLDLPPEREHGGLEMIVGTTWLSDAGMRFQARWLAAG